MTAYKDLSREELLELKKELEVEFEDVKGKGLKLDMSRGKPSKAQLDLSMLKRSCPTGTAPFHSIAFTSIVHRQRRRRRSRFQSGTVPL